MPLQDAVWSGINAKRAVAELLIAGKRLFRRWVCHPLRSIAEIEDRQQSLEDLYQHAELRDELLRVLKDCPDLERLIARVHVGSCKLALFLDLLDAFDKVAGCAACCIAQLWQIAAAFAGISVEATQLSSPRSASLFSWHI